MQIVVATHNEGKLVEIRRILEEDLGADAENIELVSAGSLHLPDPVETGVTFQENALLKARAVAIRTGLPAVADDSGLIVDVTRLIMRCCSPKSKIFRMTSVPRASAAPPRWWSRTPRPVPT